MNVLIIVSSHRPFSVFVFWDFIHSTGAEVSFCAVVFVLNHFGEQHSSARDAVERMKGTDDCLASTDTAFVHEPRSASRSQVFAARRLRGRQVARRIACRETFAGFGERYDLAST